MVFSWAYKKEAMKFPLISLFPAFQFKGEQLGGFYITRI